MSKDQRLQFIMIFIFLAGWVTPSDSLSLDRSQSQKATEEKMASNVKLLMSKYDALGSARVELSGQQKNVSALKQLATFEIFLEIEYTCLLSFDYKFCREAVDTLITKFIKSNLLLQEDYQFIKATIEVTLSVSFFEALYVKLSENGLLDRIIEQAEQLKQEIEAGFNE